MYRTNASTTTDVGRVNAMVRRRNFLKLSVEVSTADGVQFTLRNNEMLSERRIVRIFAKWYQNVLLMHNGSEDIDPYGGTTAQIVRDIAHTIYTAMRDWANEDYPPLDTFPVYCVPLTAWEIKLVATDA